MAKVQTRRSVSVSKHAHQGLQEIATALGLPCSQLVEHAIAALVEGTLAPPAGKPAPPTATCSFCSEPGHYSATCVKRWRAVREAAEAARAASPVVVVKAATAAPPPSLEPIRLPAQLTEPTERRRTSLKQDNPVETLSQIGLCAICTNTRPVQRTQLDVGGHAYLVCASCNDEAPREAEHLFGGSAGRGVGQGNRQRTSGGLR
jgi:hypothetical protein